MSTDILTTWPSASAFEAQLANMGVKVLAGGEIDKMLKRYSEARAALARERIAATIKSTGFALAAVAEELPPREAARIARETYDQLSQLVAN
jgi:hypothetical protein